MYLRSDWEKFDHINKSLSLALGVRDLRLMKVEISVQGRAIVQLMNGILKAMVRVVEVNRQAAYNRMSHGDKPDSSKYFLDAKAVHRDRAIVALNAIRSLCIFCFAEKCTLVVGRSPDYVILS
ncbi:MAG: hypothetical protein HC859_11495 [Bacteroidia bacterium]|nr:hypothetical protein [Bacteroidia bacterium]